MPSTLSIRISNNTPHPNGNAAIMSISNANGNPNQATWTASDKSYQITLPSNIWIAPPGGSLNFTLNQNDTSGVYTLASNAPTGLQPYSIAALTGDAPPKILVQP